MYVVIFKATVADLDDEYINMAQRLHQLAFSKYGCMGFKAVTEGDQEVALSYWPSLRHIHDWKNDSLHKQAQAAGRDRWYSSYSVEICEILDSR